MREAAGLPRSAAPAAKSAKPPARSLREGQITEFTDDFDGLHRQLEEHYRRAMPLIAGTDKVDPEETLGQAMLAAGIHATRVRHFRREAIGQRPDALTSEHTAMQHDLC